MTHSSKPGKRPTKPCKTPKPKRRVSAASPTIPKTAPGLPHTPAQGMTIREWWSEVGTENVKLVIADIGTTMKYMRLLSYRCKRPGYDFAVALAASAERLTPGFVPSIEVMMTPLPERETKPMTKINPSAAYLKANPVTHGSLRTGPRPASRKSHAVAA